MKHSLVRGLLSGASRMGTQVYMLQRLELQLLMPRTAMGCQERALQELLGSAGFAPQRTWEHGSRESIRPFYLLPLK